MNVFEKKHGKRWYEVNFLLVFACVYITSLAKKGGHLELNGNFKILVALSYL